MRSPVRPLCSPALAAGALALALWPSPAAAQTPPPPPPPVPDLPPLPPSTTPTVVVLQQPPPQPPPPPGPYYAGPPSGATPVPYTSNDGSRALIGAGKAFLTIGLVGLATGAILSPVGRAIKADNTCHDPSGGLTFQCEYGSGSTLQTTGNIFLVAGALVTLGGIGLLIGGVSTRNSARRAIPLVTVATRGATLQWTF